MEEEKECGWLGGEDMHWGECECIFLAALGVFGGVCGGSGLDSG